ncbi:hypothetical protein V500_03536 [Pseudogymnoascus sp. VKM F-4518 (FW-2643)]|nr:hypothetical protein V500_03536 [Pseudogymnoascus sp. VKM F-4518 (FW-2643)]
MTPLPSFLCTFCWLPQYPPSPLKTLGTESRICCQGCWEQILDLAICWVCGEVVVRCDEADWGGGAAELEEIPVCGGCDDGLLDGGEDRDQVGLGLGRENVDRRDGGLGRARWERLMRCEDGSLSNLALSGAVLAQVVAEARPASKSDLGTIVSQAAHRSAAFNGVEESPSRTISANGEPESPASPSPVYITITDPINGPSFKPSPTKPIPRWMRQLPNGRERDQVHLLAISAIPETILEYNDHRIPEYSARAETPFYTGGEIGMEYLKRYHMRAVQERERGLQKSKTGNIALERIRERGSVRQVVDRAKSLKIEEREVWSEEEEKEMLRKELNGLFRQG